jgi:hypothetical protein
VLAAQATASTETGNGAGCALRLQATDDGSHLLAARFFIRHIHTRCNARHEHADAVGRLAWP